jgi:ATP-dependent Lon protease
MIIPEKKIKDIVEVDAKVKKDLESVPLNNMNEVIKIALLN